MHSRHPHYPHVRVSIVLVIVGFFLVPRMGMSMGTMLLISGVGMIMTVIMLARVRMIVAVRMSVFMGMSMKIGRAHV